MFRRRWGGRKDGDDDNDNDYGYNNWQVLYLKSLYLVDIKMWLNLLYIDSWNELIRYPMCSSLSVYVTCANMCEYVQVYALYVVYVIFFRML